MGLAERSRHLLSRLRRKEVRTVPVPYIIDESLLLDGRVALITGGAGGIGKAIAHRFLTSGAHVILAGRDEEKLQSAVKELGEGASYLRIDLLNVETYDAALGELKQFPDILVNCGGIVSFAPFGEISLEEYDAVMNTNVRSILFLSQGISRKWMESGTPGNILNISSGSQFKPGWTTYQVSKNALDALTTGMASFLLDHDIVVNAIAPGPVATQMLNLDSSDITFDLNPTERAVTPEEVAQWCAWLVSDIGRYSVGSTFALTGGNGFFHWERQARYYAGSSHKKHLHSAPRSFPES